MDDTRNAVFATFQVRCAPVKPRAWRLCLYSNCHAWVYKSGPVRWQVGQQNLRTFVSCTAVLIKDFKKLFINFRDAAQLC